MFKKYKNCEVIPDESLVTQHTVVVVYLKWETSIEKVQKKILKIT